MNASGNKILSRMLERLFAAIVSGPSLNCRPHSSRQRVDLTQLAKLADKGPADALRELLSDAAAFEVVSRNAMPARMVQPARFGKRASNGEASTDAQKPAEDPKESAARRAWTEQVALLSKLRVLVEEARTYENDTGAYVLNIGYPLISLPPGAAAGKHQGTRRILAPVAFIPVSVTIKSGATPSVAVECKSDEVDRVVANDALLAWIEQNTGKKAEKLYTDEEGTNAWKEIAELVRHAAGALKVEVPELFRTDALPETLTLEPAPKADEGEGKPSVISAAVLGLFPMANQGLLRDTQAMLEGEPIQGPVESFLRSDVSLDQPAPDATPHQDRNTPRPKVFTNERLIAPADPCQARAVSLARTSAGLVIHGPPGTGKSQTITNVIGDHLARSERVLFVCEKRTALDVVANRLHAAGLGSLCAVVHDPQRDQRELYMSIRDQLEVLQEVKTHPMAEQRVAKIDQELAAIHSELTDMHRALSKTPAGEEHSLHALVGRWLALSTSTGTAGGPFETETLDGLESTSLHELEPVMPVIKEVLQRALSVAFPTNPWSVAAGLSVSTLVSRPMDHFRGLMSRCHAAAVASDATADPRIPPFPGAFPIDQQALAREQLLGALTECLASADVPVRRAWATRAPSEIAKALKSLTDAQAIISTFRTTQADPENLFPPLSGTPNPGQLGVDIAVLDAYLDTAAKWWGFLAFSQKSAAKKVLAKVGPAGLPLTPAMATRAKTFLTRARATVLVNSLLVGLGHSSNGESAGEGYDAVAARLSAVESTLRALTRLHTEPSLAHFGERVASAMMEDVGPPDALNIARSPMLADLLEGLRLSAPRAQALSYLEATAHSSGLFSADWLTTTLPDLRSGPLAEQLFSSLQQQMRTLEDVLRIREALANLPTPIATATRALVQASSDAETGAQVIERAVTAAEITRRLASNPKLQSLDPRRVQTQFDRYRELDEEKREKVRDAVLHRWTTRARERLLASTGSRLSTAGADVRRRLTTRGKHAMRLRQVLALGRSMEGGDPLMDLRPVWMASPETVAQIFPREQVFDVIIFDEASQCRLEEALPVLTRAKRVVIAGDPKQLPPTRFFESAVAASDNDEIESDQQLFESQQSEVEDLLGAALGLDIQQSYLDVHYRSRNSDLIEFSNEHFYSRRLQAIPGHPRNRVRYAPLTLYHVGGTYEDRTNEREAEEVCKIVRDLLRRAEPPSIGIGCFNLAQRDLILEKLDELAMQDQGFATSLAKARERRTKGAFEGLFVKNLENVQGDERDHIIISTTYGPDAKGKFYRRFGPLALPGGGRRLNVLVTRARDEVHLVTSIPREQYSALPPIPEGQGPSGGWLLMAYLQYAERLAIKYTIVNNVLDQDEASREAPSPSITGANAGSGTPQPLRTDQVTVVDTPTPSPFASALGESLASQQHIGSVVHWGNDGFCVDLALRDPKHPDDVTVGVLCDTTRFSLAEDPVEWDIFRTDVLASQGWTLERLWSPTFFRDPRGQIENIIRAAEQQTRTNDDRDSIRTQP